MNRDQVRVGDSASFMYRGKEHSGIVQKTDNADVQQVVIGDLNPGITGQQTITVRFRDLIPPPGLKVGFAHEGKHYTGVVQPSNVEAKPLMTLTSAFSGRVVVSNIEPAIPGVAGPVTIPHHDLTSPVAPSGREPLEHEQVHAGNKPAPAVGVKQ